MLSDNSIVYILYTLFLIIIIPIFLRICASTFTGGDVEAKSPIQNIVQKTKISKKNILSYRTS